MSTRTKKVETLGAAVALSMVALMVIYPAVAASLPMAVANSQSSRSATSSLAAANPTVSGTSTQPPTNARSETPPKTLLPGPPALAVGETITFTSTAGQYSNVTNARPIGTAAGTVTFTVTGALREGYTLSLTSGSLSLGSTTLSLTGGSAVVDANQASLTGSGTVSGGATIYYATARPTFLGNFNVFSIDL